MIGQSVMPGEFPVGSFMHPAPSCKDLPSQSPPGHYLIQSTSTGYATMEYCQMTPPYSCNSVPGWMSVAQRNMSDPDERCPSGLTTRTENSKTFCHRSSPGCTSIVFPTHGVRYGKVCGEINGYQYFSPNGFGPYYHYRHSIDEGYVDGLSLPRMDICQCLGRNTL